MKLISTFLILLFFVFTIFYKAGFFGKGEYFSDYLGKTQSNSVKGIMSICIMLTHFSFQLGGINFLTPFFYSGYLVVGIFFFYSGYGLTFSVNNKPDYLKNFIPLRLTSVLLPAYLYELLYRIVDCIVNSKSFNFVSYILIFKSMWFIFAITLAYILFYICHKIPFKKKYAGDIAFCLSFIAVSLALYLIPGSSGVIGSGGGSSILSVLSIPLGVIWYYCKDKIDKFSNENWFKVVVVTGGLFVVSLAGKLLGDKLSFNIVEIIMSVISTPLFTAMLFIAIKKVKIQNKAVDFLGRISYETFLVHYSFVNFFKEFDFIKNNTILYFICVLICSLTVAYLLNLVCTAVMGALRKKLKR